MDALNPFSVLLFKFLVLMLPLSVVWLSARRLFLSKSGNAWIYAITCLFSVMTMAGLVPWAFGLMQANWVFFVFSAFCPAIWIGVVTVCDMSRRALYETDPVTDTALKFKSSQKPLPLVRENPAKPGATVPVFRHRSPVKARIPTIRKVEKTVASATKSLMSVAREMRGKETSDDRRPKLLPSPEMKSLPFLKN